jgi:hypothetical protein
VPESDVTQPRSSGAAAVPNGLVQYEEKVRDLELRVRELQDKFARASDPRWTSLATTIDAILAQLVERLLQLEDRYCALREDIEKQKFLKIDPSYIDTIERILASNVGREKYA